MKYFIILLIASFVFFGCDANNAGDDSGIGSGDGSSQDDNGGSNEDEDPQDDNGGSNADDDPQVADLCLGVNTSSITHTLDDGKDYTIIRNQEGLQAIRDDQNNLAVNYLLCADIDIDPTSTFAQLNPNTDIDNDSSTFDGTGFTGTFNGNNKTISNLRIQASQDDYVGLFGKIGANGEVRDLTLSLAEDANDPGISGSEYVGALAGRNEGTITNVGVTGGTVTGNSSVGGLVGYNAGTITASYATGNVTGNSDIGGLVGGNIGTITASYATGTVTGNSSVGGLVGAHFGGRIEKSYATSRIESDGSRLGGLVGYNAGTITASYATGTVTGAGGTVAGAGEHVGGLVGTSAGTITASYATGTVTGNSSVGGLVGSNFGGRIEKSYATGNVTGNSNIGGLVGNNIGTITASYFDVELTGQSQLIGNESVADRAYHTNTADGQVYTEAAGAGDLIAQGNFSTWDATIWTWQEGQWPTFQFQTTMTTQ